MDDKSMASGRESEDEKDKSYYVRPRGRPRKELDDVTEKTKRRRINEDFRIPRPKDGSSKEETEESSRSPSPPIESGFGCNSEEDSVLYTRDCVGDLPNYILGEEVLGEEDQLTDLCDVHDQDEETGHECADNLKHLNTGDSFQVQDAEVLLPRNPHIDDFLASGDSVDDDQYWFDFTELGPLHYYCDVCIACVCVNCSECVHRDDGDCSHCFSCLCDLDSELGDSDVEGEEESSSESEDEPVLSEEEVLNRAMKADLVSVCLNHDLPHDAIDDILGFLRKYDVGEFPKRGKTLLKTAEHVILRDVPPGKYWHNGITKHLVKYATSNSKVSVIDITFSSDGVPLFNSSNVSFWPLTCSFNDDPEVYVIGLYLGDKKPDDPNEYLKDFANEVIPLCQEGLCVKGKNVSVNILKGIFDAVARSWILKVMGCNAKNGCFKCSVEGETEDHRMHYTDLNATLRTDEGFVNYVQRRYHKGSTILVTIPRFGCVSSVPLDYMHLVLLGVMRKLIYMWIGGPLAVRQGSGLINAISGQLVSLVGWVPSEFVRKTRSLQHVKRFKATEYRLLLLYVGLLVFKLLPCRLYEHFLVFHVVMTIFVDPEFCKTHLQYAKELSAFFVQTFSELYGYQYVSHNVHSVIHLHIDVEKFGPVDNFSAFKFENFYQMLKKLVRKGDKPLQQVAKRYLELEAHNSALKKKASVVEAPTVGGRHNRGTLLEG